MAKLKDLQLNARGAFIGSYKTGRGRLAAFLTDLPPLFRRLLTGDGLHPFDFVAFNGLDASGRKHFKKAETEYLRHLRDAASKRPLTGVLVDAELLDNATREEFLYSRDPTHRGAPEKELGLRWEVQISIEAERLEERLQPGLELTKRLRATTTYGTDEKIRQALSSLGFGIDEIEAIVHAQNARGAVARLLSMPHYYGRKLATVRAAISRGRRLRRDAAHVRRSRTPRR